MAIVFALEHPEHLERCPPVRLTLTGASLVTSALQGDNIQNFPTREVAKAHLDRVLRLRREQGYLIVESGEIPGDENVYEDPVGRLFRHNGADGWAHVDFSEGPISPEESAAAIARIAAAAPVGIDYLREDPVPGGIFGAGLAGAVLPSVKALIYRTFLPEQYYQMPFDDITDVLAALPNVERVEATTKFTMREIHHGAIRELHLCGEPLFLGTVAALGDGSLPALETLGLLLGKGHGLDRVAGAALRTLDAPRLQAIQVADLEDVTRFLAELTERPLPASWVMLYLEGSIGDEDELLGLLRERAPALRSIAMLGLPLADELSEGGVAEVKTLLPQVVDVSDLPELRPSDTSAKW
jgi:hypothetical protein